MEEYMNVFLRHAPEPVYCYRSGLMVYEERLLNGAVVAGGWNASGYPLNVLGNLATHIDNQPFVEPSTFHVEVDGECMDFFLQEQDFQTIERENGCLEAILKLRSTVKPVEISLHTLLDGTAMLTRWLEVTNLTTDDMALSRLSVFSGALEQMKGFKDVDHNAEPEDIYEIGYFENCGWGMEGQFTWKPLNFDKTVISGRFTRGRNRHPAFFLRNKLNGQIYWGQLGWTAGYEFSFDYIAESESADISLGIEISVMDHHPLYRIEPGATFVSPKVHLGVMFGGLDDAVNETYAHIRKSVLNLPEASAKECLVTSGIGPENSMSLEESKCYAKQMAELGVEIFTVDAGWFCPPGKEGEWHYRIGDWHYDRDRYPNGIGELRDYVHDLGMKFGMWMGVEVRGEERVHYPEHPDWRTKLPFRTSHISFLDFTNPDVVEWAEAEISRVIMDYKLDLFRIDHNAREFNYFYRRNTKRLEFGSIKHYQAICAMYERLKKRFPNVVFENCAGGGGRTDLAMLYSFNHTWVSDWQKAPRSLFITSGMTMVLPPERVDRLAAGMGCHVHGSLDFHMRNTMFGHMTLNSFCPLNAKYNKRQLEFVKHCVDIYKSFIRPFLPNCKMYHHNETVAEARERGFCGLETVAYDKTKAVIGVFGLPGANNKQITIMPRGLDAGNMYKVTFDNTGAQVTRSGVELINSGITTAPLSALTSELILLEKI